jgi:hypothetical protein
MKVFRFSQFSFFAVVLSVVTSCAPVYIANTRNAPMFSGKNEAQASATVGVGYNAQLAYSFTNHFGVIGNFLYANNKPQKKFTYRTQSYGELGAGYYTNFKSFAVEIFAGYGKGNGTAFDSVYYIIDKDVLYHASATYNKFFIQPDIGMKNWPNFEWSFSPRLGFVNFNDLMVSKGDQVTMFSKKKYFFLEPSLNLKINLHDKKYFLMMQGGSNIFLHHHQDRDFNIQAAHVVVGLQIKFSGSK